MFNFLVKTLIVLFLVFVFLSIIYLIVRHKIRRVFNENFGTSDIKKVFEMSEKESIETPKSLSSMEQFIIPRLKEDFPDLNIQEIKSMVEVSIIKCLTAIEKKDISDVKKYGERVVSYVSSVIDDLGKDVVNYDSIKIHKTVLNNYNKNDMIATLYLQTSFEYLYKKNNGNYKKKQGRVKTEFIYIIDASKIKSERIKAIGLNCPNCGAPITSLGAKKCKYCGSNNLDIVKRTWNLNNFSIY